MPLKKKCVSCIKKPKTQNNSFVAPNINSQESTPKPKPKSSPKLVHKPKPKQKTIVDANIVSFKYISYLVVYLVEYSKELLYVSSAFFINK